MKKFEVKGSRVMLWILIAFGFFMYAMERELFTAIFIFFCLTLLRLDDIGSKIDKLTKGENNDKS